MQISKVLLTAGAVSGAVLMSGCATTNAPRPLYSYYSVPCDTPGAVQAIPITMDDAPATSPSAAAAPVLPAPAPSPTDTRQLARAAPARPAPARCVIAVADRGRYGGGYGGYGGYRPGYYGLPFYSGVGIGFGFGGHLGGTHHRGFGGGHGGGHRRHR